MEPSMFLPPQSLTPRGGNISYSDSRNLPLPSDTMHSEYIVKQGDTIMSIAQEFGVTPVQLAEWLREQYGIDTLYEGQPIKIPTKIETI